jgi:hypothetical protein
MKNNKFNILFESYMNELSDKEIFGSDIHNAILKVFKLNTNTNEFDDLIQEIDNFKYLEPNNIKTEELQDLLMEPGNWDDNFEVCKIMVFDKKTNKLLFEGITLLGTDSNDIIDLISANDNPRGTFEGVTEESAEITEDSDKFDESIIEDNTIYNGFKINIESFDDQGDTVFMWRFNANKRTYSDDKYYNTLDDALNTAKLTIDNLLKRRYNHTRSGSFLS